MADVGIQSAGQDISTLFAARVHTAVPNTGIQSNGTDIAQTFESIAYGTGPAATEILSAGADLNTIFGTSSGTFTITITTYPQHFNSSPTFLTFSVTSESGGTPPYAYDWTAVNLSGSGSISITSSNTAASVDVTVTAVSGGHTFGYVQLKITDSLSNTATAQSYVYMVT